MADMADALAKAGLITQQTADRVERDMRKAEADEKKEEKASHRPPPKEIKTSEEYKKFEGMWANPKSKGF